MSRRTMLRSPRRHLARRADNRRRRLAIEPLEDRRLLAVMSFQDGVLPTRDYDGTRDVPIFGAEPDVNFGEEATLRADAEQSSTNQPVWSLLKWDLSSIPIGSTLNDVSITVNVTNVSVDPGFNLYSMKTPWFESEVTWNRPDADGTWEEPGIVDPLDVGTTVLGTMTGTAIGRLSVLLNAAGRAVVEGWINDPLSNHGFLLANPDNDNSLRFDSREAETAANRPKFTIDFEFTDTFPPTATLIDSLGNPLDGGLADQDGDESEVRIGSRGGFRWQLFDVALDDSTVTPEAVTITLDGVAADDIAFAFDVDSAVVTLTPLAGRFSAGIYVVTFSGGASKIADEVGNDMPPTVFTIEIDEVLPFEPTARNDTFETDEDVPLVVNVENGLLANDDDGQNTALRTVLADPPSHGSVSLAADGSFVYTPAADFHGRDGFAYRIDTSLFPPTSATVSIEVLSIADAPAASDDSFNIVAGGELSIDAPGLLANDVDGDGDELTAVLLTSPENGELTFSADGAFSYVPNPLFVGVDTFTYAASDAQSESPATVTITVHLPGSIGGTVWDDKNRDGLFDATEPGLADWTVFFDANENGLLDADESRVQSDAEGNYEFPGLLPGDYAITVAAPSDWQPTSPASRRGELTFVQELFDGSNGIRGLDEARGMSVSPDGRNIYVSSLTQDSVSVFDRDPATGEVSFVEVHIDGVNGVDGLNYGINVKVSPDGRHVYATGRRDNAIAHFDRDMNTGKLTFIDLVRNGVRGVNGLDGAAGLAISEDGRHVYASARDDGAVAVFSRDAETGTLTFVHSMRGGVAGVPPLPNANHVAISPDGGSVYVASAGADTVAVFSREAVSGRLTFVESLREGVNGIAGLDGLYHLVVSHDNAQVYVASGGGAIATFSRDTTTGRLTPLQLLEDGVDGIDGLTYATEVTLSRDGQSVYVASNFGQSMVVFDRDVKTGMLTAVQTLRQGIAGVGGLNQPYTVIVSPDGENVYTGTRLGNSIAVFDREFQLPVHFVTVEAGEDKTDVNFGNYSLMPQIPVVRTDKYTGLEDETLVVDAASGVLANDHDPQGDEITAILVRGVREGVLTLNPDGSFTYQPNENFVGPDSFRYRASDGENESASTLVQITIENVNDPPVAVDDAYTVDRDEVLIAAAVPQGTNLVKWEENGHYYGIVAGSRDWLGAVAHAQTQEFRGATGHLVTITSMTENEFLKANVYDPAPTDGIYIGLNDIEVEGLFRWVTGEPVTFTDWNTREPNNAGNEDAVEVFRGNGWRWNDTNAGRSRAAYVIEFNVVAQASILDNDVDPDGDDFTATLEQNVQHGTLSLTNDGSFTYTPDQDFTGIDSFTYIATDGELTSNVATVTIRVGVEELPADLTGNGFVDFEDLTILLANWNQNVPATEGNLVSPLGTPVNFEDLTVLLAAWTEPGPAGSPQPAATETIVQRDTANPEARIATNTHFYRLGRRGHVSSRRANRISGLSSHDSPLRRLQAIAVDHAMADESTTDGASTLRRRARHGARR